MTKKKTAKKTRRAPPRQAGPEGSDFVPIDSIRPWVDNPRKNAHAVAKVQEAIKRFGWIRPIVANSHPRAKGEIIVGHTAHGGARRRARVRTRALCAAGAEARARGSNRR
jgi:hypothetical protein